jgi:hypothetical protein
MPSLVAVDHIRRPMPAGDEARARAFHRGHARLGGSEATAPCTSYRPLGPYFAM